MPLLEFAKNEIGLVTLLSVLTLCFLLYVWDVYHIRESNKRWKMHRDQLHAITCNVFDPAAHVPIFTSTHDIDVHAKIDTAKDDIVNHVRYLIDVGTLSDKGKTAELIAKLDTLQKDM